jgi:2-phosphosulfolactate phosphatase
MVYYQNVLILSNLQKGNSTLYFSFIEKFQEVYMHIDLVFSPLELARCENLSSKTAIVIDVLRASTTMIYAFNAFDNDDLSQLCGVKEIIPAKDTESAIMLYNTMKEEDLLLGGEEEGFPPTGFHLGNSPYDYIRETVQGKTLIMATTNGTKTITLVREAKHIIVGAFVNAFAVARKCIILGQDVIIACAGRSDISGLEDITCGGLITSYIKDLAMERPVRLKLSDSAIIAMNSLKTYNSVLHILQSADHGRYLYERALEKDLYPCSLKNKFNIVPWVSNNTIFPELLEPVVFSGAWR